MSYCVINNTFFICRAVRLCNKMIKAINALEYFMLRDWTFHNENVQSLWTSISRADRRLFHFNIAELDWSQYIDRYQKGCKKFILKEGVTDDDIERAHRNMYRMLWIHRIFQMAIMYAAWCLVSSDLSVSCLSTIFNEAVKMLSLSPVISAVENESASIVEDLQDLREKDML